jgi:hypothetical protein
MRAFEPSKSKILREVKKEASSIVSRDGDCFEMSSMRSSIEED